MFCGNCGSQNPDGAVICTVCGAPLTPEKPAKKAGFDLKSMDRNKLIGLGVIAAVVLVALILVLVLVFSGRGAESTLKDYAKGVLTLDAKKVVKCIPDADIEDYAEEEDISKSEAKQEIIDDLQDILDNFEDVYDEVDPEEIGRISVEIRDKDKWTSKEVRDYNAEYEDDHNVKINIKEGMTVEVKFTVKCDGEEYKYKITGVDMIKIGGSWYLTSESAATNTMSVYGGLNTEMQ